MKLIATIDYWDGTPGLSRELHAEDIHGRSISMLFTSPHVASITITRPPNLAKVLKPEGE